MGVGGLWEKNNYCVYKASRLEKKYCAQAIRTILVINRVTKLNLLERVCMVYTIHYIPMMRTRYTINHTPYIYTIYVLARCNLYIC